jgi:hypothetical protein
MKIDYSVDLSGMLSGAVRVGAVFALGKKAASLRLPALLAKTRVEVKDLRALSPAGESLSLKISGEKISMNAPGFTLEYVLRIKLKECVGTDKEAELLYPFLNASELFLGSGALPYPEELERLASGIAAELHVSGLPPGWAVFSSLTEGAVSAACLDSFFIYCSKGQAPRSYTYKGRTGGPRFRLLVQKGKSIPLSSAEVWEIAGGVMNELEKSFGPYAGAGLINILILQPPSGFERLARGATFATGENMLGGIAVYTPKSSAYIERLFGHGSYAYHLRDGLTHELTHFYSTTAWQGRYKSLLFPSAACPAQHKRLIGEILTAYFHEAVMRRNNSGSKSFLSGKILPQLAAWKLTGKKKPLLELFLLDLWLRSKESSLKGAVNRLLTGFGRAHKPYRSGAALTQAAVKCAGAPLPSYLRRALLTAQVPDYARELKAFPGWDNEKYSPLSGKD